MCNELRSAMVFSLLIAIGCPALARADERKADVAHAPQDLFFDSNGVRIHYTDEGNGEPVVLIHGFTASIVTNWGLSGFRSALAKEYRVIALDNRGHGKSDKPHDPAKYGMEMVEDAVRLLDHLHIKKAHFIGYSMGGIITLKLAAIHPDRLLTATLGGAGWMRESDLAGDNIADVLETGGDLGEFIPNTTAPGQPKPSQQQVKLLSTILSWSNDNKALAAVARSWKKLEVTEQDLKAIPVPMLAVVGANDFVRPKVDDLKGLVPNLRTVVINKTDHFTTIFAAKFPESVQSFLKEHRQPDAAKQAHPRIENHRLTMRCSEPGVSVVVAVVASRAPGR